MEESIDFKKQKNRSMSLKTKLYKATRLKRKQERRKNRLRELCDIIKCNTMAFALWGFQMEKKKKGQKIYLKKL